MLRLLLARPWLARGGRQVNCLVFLQRRLLIACCICAKEMLVYLTVFTAGFYFLSRTKFFGTVVDKGILGLSVLSIPLYVAWILMQWIWKRLVVIHEFIEMFYEENCPPITLISSEEALVEGEDE